MRSIEFIRTQWGKGVGALLFVVMVLFPFQKRHHGLFKHVFKKWYPADMVWPKGFSKTLSVEWADLAVLGLVGLLVWKYRVSLRRLFWEGPSKFLTLFLGCCAVSIICSDLSGFVFQYLWLFKFSLSALVFYALRACVEGQYFVSWVRTVAWVFVAVALVASMIGIAEYFTQQSLGFSFLGERSTPGFQFPNPSRQLWLFSEGTGSPYVLRSFALFSHPNPFGAFVFMAFLFGFYLYFREETKWRLRLLEGCVTLFAVALTVSFCRSAVLALGLGTVLFFALEVKRNLRKVGMLSAVLVGSFALCLVVFYPPLFSRGMIVSQPVIKESNAERMTYHRIALDMAQEHPLVGVGFNSFQFHSEKYLPKDAPYSLFYKVHNIYLLVLAETGFLGLAAFLLFLGACARSGVKGLKSLEGKLLCALFLGVFVIGGCDMFFLDKPKLRIAFFTLLALLSLCEKKEEVVV